MTRYLQGPSGYGVLIPTPTEEEKNLDDDLQLYVALDRNGIQYADSTAAKGIAYVDLGPLMQQSGPKSYAPAGEHGVLRASIRGRSGLRCALVDLPLHA